MARPWHRNTDCSVYVGNIDERVTEELLWELFLQAGPVKSVYIPFDKETEKQKPFGFVEFVTSASAHYAWELLDGIKLFRQAVSVRPQKKEGKAPATWIPRHLAPATNFYKDFYDKRAKMRRQAQSEPRKSRSDQKGNHSDNRSNRSFTEAQHHNFSSPHVEQRHMHTPTHIPMLTPHYNYRQVQQRRFMGSPFEQMLNQTPPSQQYYRY